MTTIKGLTGNVTATAGNTILTINDYGVPSGGSENTPPSPPPQGVGSGPGTETGGVVTYNTLSARTAVLEDPVGDITAITVAPSRGKMVVRDDGFISWNDNDNIDAATISFTYERDNNGTLQIVSGVIEAAKGELAGGWALPAYYLPEVDGATDDLVVEPGPTSRVVYCSETGVTGDTIRSEQGLDPAMTNSVTATQVRNNPQWGYGNTPATAIHPEVGFWLYKRLGDKRLESPFFLLKRGDTFPDVRDFNADNQQNPGQSALHPKYIGCYGDPADPLPYVAGTGFGNKPGGENMVVTSMGLGGTSSYSSTKYLCVDNISADYEHVEVTEVAPPVAFVTPDFALRHCTLRRYKALDVVKKQPNNGIEWSFGNDRVSAFYGSEVQDFLIEKFYSDHAAWSDNYRRDTAYVEISPGVYSGMSPDDRSHSMYIQSSSNGVTIRDLFSSRPNFNAGQFRSGAVAQHCFAYKCNGHFVFGGSWGRTSDPAHPDYKPDTNNYAPWSIGYRIGGIGAGLKNCDDGPAVVGAGPAVNAPRMIRMESYILNAGTPVYFSGDGSEVANGPKMVPGRAAQITHKKFATNNLSGVTGYIHGTDDLIASNWNREDLGDLNVGATSEAERDAITVDAFLDDFLGTTGSTEADFEAYCRSHDAPWNLVRPINNFALDPFGKPQTQRTVAQVCTFTPFYDPANGWETPGMRADVELDWDTRDLPGTVAGDSVDLAGHSIWWNQTPTNTLSGFTFGAGGKLHQLGGALRPASIAVDVGGNIITMDHGSKFDLPGYSGAGNLDVTVDESRWMNTGDVAGNVSLKGRYESEVIFATEGGSFTLGSSDTADIYGYCRAGFHGSAGGAATLTAQSGSVIRFKPSIRIQVSGDLPGKERVGSSGPAAVYSEDWIMAKNGSMITGVTSGATGTVLKVLDSKTSPSNGVQRRSYVLVDVTGTFIDGEDLTASTLTLREKYDYPAGIVGQAYEPVYVMGSIAEVTTGLNGFGPDGFTAPSDVNSIVTLESGSTIEVDKDGLAPGTYPLISVDSLTDNGANLPEGVTVSGNTLQLVVT